MNPLSECPHMQEGQDAHGGGKGALGGGVMSIRNLTVTPSHWHPCAQTSRDPSDARDMAPHSPVYGHCRECTLGLTQSNKRFFSPSKALAVPEHRGFFFDSCKRVLGFGSSGGTQAAQCRRVQGLSPLSQLVLSLSIMGPQGHGQSEASHPSPAAPTTTATSQKLLHSVVLREGGTAGAGSSGGDTTEN